MPPDGVTVHEAWGGPRCGEPIEMPDVAIVHVCPGHDGFYWRAPGGKGLPRLAWRSMAKVERS